MTADESDKRAALDIINELQERITEIFGFYYDGKLGFVTVGQEMLDRQKRLSRYEPPPIGPAATLEELGQQIEDHIRSNEQAHLFEPMTVEQLDNCTFVYGNGDPGDPTSVAMHSVSQGDLKRRNQEGGRNHEIIDYAVISLLYSIWSDKYRPQIASTLGVQIRDISSDIFGDIRHIRNSIIHHDGIALEEVKNCKQLKYFNPGDRIVFSDGRMDNLLLATLKGLDLLAQQLLGVATEFGVRRNAMGQLPND
jgi:hypothetical protein